MRFNNKVALVTGAGSGIGLATVRRLASESARVVAAVLDEAQRGRDTLRSRDLVDALGRELRRYAEATTWRQDHLGTFSQKAWELVDQVWRFEVKDNEALQNRTGWRSKKDLYEYVNNHCPDLQRCRAFAKAVKHPRKEQPIRTSAAFTSTLKTSAAVTSEVKAERAEGERTGRARRRRSRTHHACPRLLAQTPRRSGVVDPDPAKSPRVNFGQPPRDPHRSIAVTDVS